MDINDFFQLSNLVFCIVIYLLTHGFRKLISQFIPKIDSNNIYINIIIPTLPIIFGIAGVFSGYPIPTSFSTIFAAKIFWGAFCGLLSGHAFKIIKPFVKI